MDQSRLFEEDFKGGRVLSISKDEIQPGDIVVYMNPTDNQVAHVAVVIGIKVDYSKAFREVSVISQWGADGEYIHLIDDVPDFLGKPKEFWTDRRSIP